MMFKCSFIVSRMIVFVMLVMCTCRSADISSWHWQWRCHTTRHHSRHCWHWFSWSCIRLHQ